MRGGKVHRIPELIESMVARCGKTQHRVRGVTGTNFETLRRTGGKRTRGPAKRRWEMMYLGYDQAPAGAEAGDVEATAEGGRD